MTSREVPPQRATPRGAFTPALRRAAAFVAVRIVDALEQRAGHARSLDLLCLRVARRMRGMQDQTGLFGVVLLGRHEHCPVAGQLTALADEREQTTGRAEPAASIGVESLPQLAMHDLSFRGTVLSLEGRGDPYRRTQKTRGWLRAPWASDCR